MQRSLQLEEQFSIALRAEKSAVFSAYRDSDIRSPGYGAQLCVLQIPIVATHVKVIDTRQNAVPTSLHRSLASAGTAIGSLNGSYFAERAGHLVPLGLVKVEGRRTNQPHPWRSGGVFAVTGREVRIVPIRKFIDRPATAFALQSNTLLIEDGRNGIRDRYGNRADRSAIAITDDGHLVMAVLHEPGGQAGSLFDFAEILRSLKSPAGGRIEWAMNMDGGPGAHLQIAQSGRHCGPNADGFIPNMIVAFL